MLVSQNRIQLFFRSDVVPRLALVCLESQVEASVAETLREIATTFHKMELIPRSVLQTVENITQYHFFSM